MNVNFFVVQGVGILAWLVLLISYYREDTDKILIYHVVATSLYCLHYYMLEAYSGVFICFFEVVRDLLYYKTTKDDYIFVATIPVYIISGIISYSKWFDLLPVASSLFDGYFLTKKRDFVLIGAIISYSLWIIYNIYVMSIAGIIADGLVVFSNLCILCFGFNPFSFKRKSKESLKLR